MAQLIKSLLHEVWSLVLRFHAENPRVEVHACNPAAKEAEAWTFLECCWLGYLAELASAKPLKDSVSREQD